MGYYELPFTVLRISGQAQKLLDGITTNTQRSGRNAFIDVYGKLIATFYQHYENSDALIALPTQFKERLLEHLKKYLTISKAKIEDTNLSAFFITEQLDVLNGIKIPEKKGFVLLSEKPPQGIEEISAEEFKCWRIENEISMQGEEFDREMIMNTDWSDAVSFSKGCFLGQEIAVKIMHRGKPPRALARFAFSEEPKEIRRNGEVVGELRSKCFSEKLGKWIAYCSIPNDGQGIDGAEQIA